MIQHNFSNFQKVWESLKETYFHGEFMYSAKESSFKKVVRKHFSKRSLDDSFGVYVIRRINNNEIIYIGKAGTVNSKGRFSRQDLSGRLTNRRGKESSEYWFKQIVEQEGPILVEYVVLPVTPQSPALVEATLLQAFLNQENMLPRYNKSL